MTAHSHPVVVVTPAHRIAGAEAIIAAAAAGRLPVGDDVAGILPALNRAAHEAVEAAYEAASIGDFVTARAAREAVCAAVATYGLFTRIPR